MEKTITNIKKVSLLFFVVTGLLHFVSTLFLANKLYPHQSFIVNKTMDIPLVVTGMLYGLSSLRLALTDPQKKHKILDISLISIIILILVALIAINFALPLLRP